MDSKVQEFLEGAAHREQSNLVSLPIRELIAIWGNKRRTSWLVSRIERDLEGAGLVTEPSFAQGWIDGTVTLVPKGLLQPTETSAGDGVVSLPREEGAAEPGK